MNNSQIQARRSLQAAFLRRREALARLGEQLRDAITSADNPSIRRAFHALSAAIEGRIVWEQGTILPALARDQFAAEAGCAAHVESDHQLLLGLLDAFGDWLVSQPLALDAHARGVGMRHFDRLWNVLRFHDQREADFTYPALSQVLSSEELMRLASGMEALAPSAREIPRAA
jgi:hypothetical protein